jgi:hypothetical protein
METYPSSMVVFGERLALGRPMEDAPLPAGGEAVEAVHSADLALPVEVRLGGRVWLRLYGLEGTPEARARVTVNGAPRAVDVPILRLRRDPPPIYLGRLGPHGIVHLQVSRAHGVLVEPMFLVDDSPEPERPPRPLWEALLRVVLDRVLR